MSTKSNVTPVGDLTVCDAMCCMITGWDFTWPQCWGCGLDGVFICCKTNTVCCKLMDERKSEDGKMFTCMDGGCFLVQPKTCCQLQDQCCCLDSRCAFPCTEQVPLICTCLPCCVLYPKVGCCLKVKDIKPEIATKTAEAKEAPHVDLTDVPLEYVRVCEACCCSICGLFFKTPECIGGKMDGMCLCLQCEEACCKVIKADTEDGICFVCCNGGYYVVMPSTCIQMTNQFFCIDSRCAFPCTPKVPCICTCLPGCVVAADKQMKFACCPLIKDIVPDSGQVTDISAAPKQAEMK